MPLATSNEVLVNISISTSVARVFYAASGEEIADTDYAAPEYFTNSIDVTDGARLQLNVPPTCTVSTIHTFVGGYIKEQIECFDFEQAELSGTI